MKRLLLVSLVACGGGTTRAYKIDGIAQHRDQLVIVATRTTQDDAKVSEQTLNACNLADEGDRLVCRPLGLELDARQMPLGIQYKDGKGGAEVTRVFDNSPAASSGLAKGDVIEQVDGRRTGDANELREALAHTTKQTTLTINRRGAESTLTVDR
jgi:S1-C subfamily serine protease